jgi:hypothetical protein
MPKSTREPEKMFNEIKALEKGYCQVHPPHQEVPSRSD